MLCLQAPRSRPPCHGFPVPGKRACLHIPIPPAPRSTRLNTEHQVIFPTHCLFLSFRSFVFVCVSLSFLGDCADTTTKERKWEKEARRASVEQVGKGKRLVGTRLTLPPPHQEGERARVSEERIEEERQKATNKRKNQIGKCSTKTGCLQNSFKCVQAVLF